MPTLRRELGGLETVAMSVGVMAPTLAMSITGVEAAKVLGRAAPLTYALAGLGLGFVVFCFAQLSARIRHAGSAYAFVGHGLGPRAGFVAGWAMLGTYLVFQPVSLAGIAIFGQAFLRESGIAPHAPWLPLALAGGACVWFAASRDVRVATRSLLVVELVSMALIVVLIGVIFAKLGFGGAPKGRSLTWDVFNLPPGTDVSTVALAGTVGFLSYAGFESAASLGEETHHARRAIPRSLVIAIVVGAVFYVVCMSAQSLGFGADAAGTNRFTSSAAPLGDLAHTYIGRAAAEVLDLGAVLSAFGAALGGASVGARMLFALGRDGIAPGELAGVSRRTGAPARGVAVVMVLAAIGLIVYAAQGTPPIHVFFYFGTMGILSLLVVYLMVSLAAGRALFFGPGERLPRWQLVFPLGALGIVGYTLGRNLFPRPAPPFSTFHFVVGAWLALGIVLSVVVPGLAGRVRDGLRSPAGPAEPERREPAQAVA